MNIAEDSILLFGLVGVGFIAGAFVFAVLQSHRRKARIDAMNTKFLEAVERLGSANSMTRSSAVYALGFLQKQSYRRYEDAVVEVLTTHIRRSASASEMLLPDFLDEASDVDAAITVLAQIARRKRVPPWNVHYEHRNHSYSEEAPDLAWDSGFSRPYKGGKERRRVLYYCHESPWSNLDGDTLDAVIHRYRLMWGEEHRVKLGREEIIRGTKFDGRDLRGQSLEKKNLSSMSMRRANLEGVTLAYGSLWDADLTQANLKNVNLKGAICIGAYFCRADLEGADLSQSGNVSNGYSGTNFTLANLKGANLKNSVFYNAMFFGADLSGANCKGANFKTAKGLTCEQLSEAIIDDLTVAPDGKLAKDWLAEMVTEEQF